MNHNIEQALGNEYSMFFHAGLDFTQFESVQTLEKCVNTVNYLIHQYGRDFSQWDPSNYQVIAQIMRASWIYQQLKTEPIRKPILVHKEHNKFVVDCGDTRLMAVSALQDPPKLSALITVKNSQAKYYSDWIQIKNNMELIKTCGLNSDSAVVRYTSADPNLDWCITWLEIGDQSTSHHLHNVKLRVDLLQRWLTTQPDNFEFTTDWIRCPIDWAKYQSN